MSGFIDLSHNFADDTPGFTTCNLAVLGAAPFRFFAVPIKARGAASMPIRAFAQVT